MKKQIGLGKTAYALATVAACVTSGSAVAVAGEVDLTDAGCPGLPDAGRFMTVHLMLDGDGTASECVISSDPEQYCDRVHSYEEGFLCLGMTHNPRPDIIMSETSNSKMNDRLIVDGEVVPESYGKRVLRKDLGTGPSGTVFDVIAEQSFDGLSFSLVVEAEAVPDGPVKFNSLHLVFAE